MHQFRIEAQKYAEGGYLIQETETRYADNHEQARIISKEYENMKYANGIKMWKVTVYVLCYKAISDSSAFFAQFQA